MIPEWAKVLAGSLALMIGASLPPIAVLYFTPPRVATLGQPKDQNNLQYTESKARVTEPIPFVVKVIPSEPTPQSEQRDKEKAEQDRKLADSTVDLAFYTEFLVIVTGGLAVATFGLAVLGYRQIREARKSITATVKLAEVAETTARHVERPYVFLSDMKAQYVSANTLARLLVGQKDDDTKTAIDFKYTMQNHGRTPAIVYEVRHEIDIIQFSEILGGGVVHTPPSTPEYNGKMQTIVEVISADGKTGEQSHTFSPRPTVGPFRDIPVIYGYVKYRDVSGRHYQAGFGFVWVGDKFRPYSDEYNYDREFAGETVKLVEANRLSNT